MASDDKDEREGLLTTIRARRKWYLVLYFLQMCGWLILVVVDAASDIKSTDTVSQRVLDAAVTMAFIGQGTLVATIFLIDVVFDGGRYLIGKGGEIMGLLFSPVKNRFVAQGIAEGVAQGLAQGVAEGLAQGEKKADARLEAWLASNPEIQKLIDEGKAKAPPTLNGNNDRR